MKCDIQSHAQLSRVYTSPASELEEVPQEQDIQVQTCSSEGRVLSLEQSIPATPPPYKNTKSFNDYTIREHSSNHRAEEQESRGCIPHILPRCCYVKVRRYSPPTVMGQETKEAIPHYSPLHQGMMEYTELIAELERRVQEDSIPQKHLARIIYYLQQDRNGKSVLTWNNTVLQRSLKDVSKELAKQISEEKGAYPLIASSQYIHPAVFSDLSTHLLSENDRYKMLHENFSAFKEEKEVKVSNAIMNTFFQYTLEEKIALYCILFVLMERGIFIESELLAILDLNIRNEAGMIKVNHIEKYKEAVEKVAHDMKKLTKTNNIPSSLLYPNILQFIVKLQNISLLRRRQSSANNTIFQWQFIDQRSILPSSVHLYPAGACLLLSRLFSYFLASKGVTEGEKAFRQCFHDLTTIANYKQKHAEQLLRAICAFNEDILMADTSNIVKGEELMLDTDNAEEHNNAVCLTLLEIASVIFNPTSCKGEQYFIITEQTDGGLHACALVREIRKNPDTEKDEVCIYYLEPNYGMITTNSQSLFEHAMIRMKKERSGFSIEYDNPLSIEGYKNRFNNHLIDLIEGRFFDNPNMRAEYPHNPDIEAMKVNTYMYNYYQGYQENILARLFSLWTTWEYTERVLQECNITPPSIYLDGDSELYTPQLLGQFYKESNVREYTGDPQAMAEQTLATIDLYQASEYKDKLYRFLRALLHNLELSYNMVTLPTEQEQNKKIHKVINMLHTSITNMRTFMIKTLTQERE